MSVLPLTLSRYTGNPRYSPIGSKRSGEKDSAGPLLYQRAPLNSSHTPLAAPLATGVITVRRGRVRDGSTALSEAARGTMVPPVPTAPSTLSLVTIRSRGGASDAVSTGNVGT